MMVFIYFNLHKHLWSVKALSGSRKGKVIYHAESVRVNNPVCKVSEAGRQRVLRERRKNVHAGITGWLTDCIGDQTDAGLDVHVSDLGWSTSTNWVALPDHSHTDVVSIRYNPYKAGHFYEGIDVDKVAPRAKWGTFYVIEGRPLVQFNELFVDEKGE